MSGVYEFVVPLVEMTLGGIPVAAGVLLLVQVLAYVGLVDTGNQKRVATLIAALVLSGFWASTQATPGMAYADWVGLIYRAMIGAAVAALGYVKLVEPRTKAGGNNGVR